jgi:hypothetical protein
MHPIQLTSIITDDFITYTLQTACEGGINYWAQDMKINTERGVVRLVHDSEDCETTKTTFGYVDVVNAIRLILEGRVGVRKDLVDLLRDGVIDNDAGMVDTELADVIVQATVFGELVFG